MTDKHTKGPWKKSDRLNGPWWHISSEHSIGGAKCIGGRQAIATVHGESKKGSAAYAEMFEANARLIAAAPEMLEALKLLMTAHGEQLDLAFQAAQEAISKATGAPWPEA